MKASEKIPYSDRLDAHSEERIPFFATPTGRMLSAVLMIAIVVLILTLGTGRGEVIYEMDDKQLAVACRDQGPVFLSYDAIEEVSLVEVFTQGETLQAADWDGGWCGTYENREFGAYTMYAYSSPGCYILVKHEGGVLVFNDKTEKATLKAWEELTGRMEEAK